MTSIVSQFLILLFLAQHSGLQVLRSAVAPAPPLDSPFAGLVVLDVESGPAGDAQRVAVLSGTTPFVESSISAVKDWKFAPVPAQQKPAPISVTILYRARQIFSFNGGMELPQWPPTDRPPLPRVVVEPTYPVNSVAEGVVIFELQVSPDGSITHIETVQDVPSLTDVARTAVQAWKFSPAKAGGKPASGTAIAAISFLRPVVLVQ